jgi:transposase-like protein
MLDDQVCPPDRHAAEQAARGPVDDQGEVLDLVVQRRRDTEAAIKLLNRQLHNQPVDPTSITTHAAIYNTFIIQSHLISSPTLRRFRAEAATAWAAAVV